MFQPITEELLDIVLDIVNSNSHYNILENGKPVRTMEEVRIEFLNQDTESYLISVENRYIGIIDFLKNNPNDNCPWIGLLMIHGNYHSKGYGRAAYHTFEEILRRRGFDKVRIGVLSDNTGAKIFWTSLGFQTYASKRWQGKAIECYEKELIA
jgi:GNAT superfamily N-acetyltransferase